MSNNKIAMGSVRATRPSRETLVLLPGGEGYMFGRGTVRPSEADASKTRERAAACGAYFWQSPPGEPYLHCFFVPRVIADAAADYPGELLTDLANLGLHLAAYECVA